MEAVDFIGFTKTLVEQPAAKVRLILKWLVPAGLVVALLYFSAPILQQMHGFYKTHEETQLQWAKLRQEERHWQLTHQAALDSITRADSSTVALRKSALPAENGLSTPETAFVDTVKHITSTSGW